MGAAVGLGQKYSVKPWKQQQEPKVAFRIARPWKNSPLEQSLLGIT